MADPITLDFITLHEGPPVKIDGQLYHLRHPDALSIAHLKQMERIGPRAGELLQAADLDDAQIGELDALLQRTGAIVLDAPADVQARLSDLQRIQILHAFSRLRFPTRAEIGVTPPRPRKTGARPSPGSRGSTAASPPTGTNVSRVAS